MLRILGFLSLSLLCLNANQVDFKQIEQKNNLIYKDSKKFTGSFIKKDAKVFVKDGEISKLNIYYKEDEIASFEVKNNQFNGKGYVNHESLGRQNLIYKNGCIQNVKTKFYEEQFEDCNFLNGHYGKKDKYNLSSNYPYVVELDVFSFDVNGYVFNKSNINNGMIRKNNEKKVFRDSKLKRYIINIPNIGINYVVNFDKNEKIHSLSKFYVDSKTSLIAFFKDENLDHIVSFKRRINHIEKYENSKLVFKQNVRAPQKKEFDLLRNMQDVLSLENGKIYPYIILEKLKG